MFSEKKKGLHRKGKKIFSRILVFSKEKKAFTENETVIQVFSKNKVFTENNETVFLPASHQVLDHLSSSKGGYFRLLCKNRPQKCKKQGILHTLQANGGLFFGLAPSLVTLLFSTPPE